MGHKGDDRERIQEPDVVIGASVKAKKLRFRSKPETDVDFHGEVREPEHRSEIETASGSERHNLPEEVEPGVTYENVRVRWAAAARIKGDSDEEQDEG